LAVRHRLRQRAPRRAGQTGRRADRRPAGGADGYAIAQISDIHVGPTIKRAYLNAIVNKVNALKPDAIAVTGDLVDGSVQRLALHTEPLARLAAPRRRLLCHRQPRILFRRRGSGSPNAPPWLHGADERARAVRARGQSLMIAGVTDYGAQQFNPNRTAAIRMLAAAGAPDDLAVRILLAHQPRSARQRQDAGFDLQLSGHTHGGQFFPWNLFVPLQQPFVAGLNRCAPLWVYTSRGTGYWGPPKRFGAPSEITLVRLVTA
jgi:predicted MPP superfamily phosphohydrolase